MKIWPSWDSYVYMDSGDSFSDQDLSIVFNPFAKLCVMEWDFWGDDELGCMVLNDLSGGSGSVDMVVSEQTQGSMYRLTFQV